MRVKIGILITGILLLAFFDFSLGSVTISWNDLFSFFTGKLSADDTSYNILQNIRLPRVLAAIASGFCLSLAGLMMQSYFRNPLAGPYVLGITSGAGLGVALFIMASHLIGLYLPETFQLIGISGFAFAGTLVFMLIIYLASLRLQHSVSVLIAGILMGTFANALITFLQNIANGFQLQSFVYWNMGSLSNANLSYSFITLVIALISFIILLSNARSFDLWIIGEEQSQSCGLSKKSFTWMVFVLTSVLAGVTTAFYGPIAFVGLISPHIARMIFKTQLHSKLIIYSATTGIYLMLVSDIILQWLYFAQLPLNTITSLLSLPILAYIFIRKKELWT